MSIAEHEKLRRLNTRGHDRRQQARYSVDLKGYLFLDGKREPVTIADITGSGAMLVVRKAPEEGVAITIQIEGFGDLEAQVAYSGDGICGVMFTRAVQHRDELLKWLKQQL